jgi:hypothetical protein
MGPGAAGSLTIEEPTQVTVTYTNLSGTHTQQYNTSRIAYELTGTINSPKLVYEHGAIILQQYITTRNWRWWWKWLYRAL